MDNRFFAVGNDVWFGCQEDGHHVVRKCDDMVKAQELVRNLDVLVNGDPTLVVINIDDETEHILGLFDGDEEAEDWIDEQGELGDVDAAAYGLESPVDWEMPDNERSPSVEDIVKVVRSMPLEQQRLVKEALDGQG